MGDCGMKIESSLRTVLAVGVCALVAATAATAATPREIYKDWAANGRIDGHYSTRDLLGAQKDATLQGYGKGAFQPAVQQKVSNNSASTPTASAGVLGVSRSATTPRSSTLPFTGTNLLLFAAAGILLVTIGAAVRRTNRSGR
jgi:hypothetical protein